MKYVIAFMTIACRLALANVVEFTSTATWSASSSGTNGVNGADAFANSSTTMNFDVISPANSVVTGATLTLSPTTTVTSSGAFSEGGWPGLTNVLNCTPPPSTVTIFIEDTGCSDIPGPSEPNVGFPDGYYLDSITVGGSAPGFMGSFLLAGEPFSVAPGSIPTNGLYGVSLYTNASMVFTSWLDPGEYGATPVLPAFSTSSNAKGTLDVTFSVVPVPEPATYGLVCGGLVFLIGRLRKCHRGDRL